MDEETVAILFLVAMFTLPNLLGAGVGGRHANSIKYKYVAGAAGFVIGIGTSIVLSVLLLWDNSYNIKMIWIAPVVGTFVAWIVSHCIAFYHRRSA